ncbi:tetratricopeptide repeat protein [Grimontia hollisae]|uniref:Tetratricopeptide repeat protein n=1 Tax=Grimontia hollisae TaxID=673 RepID=A0A377HJQ8_GRIHO|nr:tetratricopeptide repeat protein [Grimontia hollisae]STO56324.1 tetratricopeptide repeat protein [Grimontia hollisae]
MSELNRMLSDLSSPENSEKRVAVAPIPSAWGFHFARVALALVATFAGASGIAWAVSSGGERMALPATVVEPEPVLATPAPVFSPTQKVVESDIHYVAMNTTVPASVESESVNVVPVNVSAPQQKVSFEQQTAKQAASLSVETIELTGAQLAELAYEKAQKQAQRGDTQKAVALLQDAVKYNPNHVAATNQLAGLLYGRNQWRDAENVLRKGIQSNPNAATLKLTLARMYQQSGREESALNVLAGPVDLFDQEQVRVVSMRAGLAQKLGKNLEARESYQWLTEQEPMDGRWWLGLGVSAEKTGATSDAEKAYANAVKSGGLSNASVSFARQRLAYLHSLKQEANDGR